jgi:hypothetical protein
MRHSDYPVGVADSLFSQVISLSLLARSVVGSSRKLYVPGAGSAATGDEDEENQPIVSVCEVVRRE